MILTISLIIVENIVKRKEGYQKTEDFFNQKEEFDVLFFGSSHVINGIYPMDLWKNYGIVSYNLGGYAATIATSYYNIMLACESHKPKLVVIDGYNIKSEEKIIGDSMSIHSMIDAYSASYNKYLAISDLFESKELLNKTFEYLFNFSIYHAR